MNKPLRPCIYYTDDFTGTTFTIQKLRFSCNEITRQLTSQRDISNNFVGTTFTPISPHPIHGHALASPTRRWSTAQASASTPKSDRSSTELVSPLTPRYPPAPPPGGAGQPPSFQTQLNFSGQTISSGHYKVSFKIFFVLLHFLTILFRASFEFKCATNSGRMFRHFHDRWSALRCTVWSNYSLQ